MQIECVVVGDDGVGKTCLIISHTTNKFPSKEVFDLKVVQLKGNIMIYGKEYTLGLFEDVGQTDSLRPLIYAKTDVFLVCFSVVSHSSFENIKQKWVPEIRHYCPKTPFIIVGTQIDRRDDAVYKKLNENNQIPIPSKAGEELAKELKAVKYVECSALTQTGLKNVFDEAVLAMSRSIKLKFVGEDQKEIGYWLQMKKQFGEMKNNISERVGVQVGSLRFLFNGRLINDTDTPERLNMETDDVIELFCRLRLE